MNRETGHAAVGFGKLRVRECGETGGVQFFFVEGCGTISRAAKRVLETISSGQSPRVLN